MLLALTARVIKPAVEEVNRTSNILVTPETRKMGRTMTEIRFLIRENPQLAILDLDDGVGVRKSPVYDRLVRLGASDRLARQWIAEHRETVLAGKLDYVEGQGEVRNPVGYLTAALKGDYGAPPKATAPVASPQIQARAERLRRIQEVVASRTPTQRDADRRLFLSRLDGAERGDFERFGWMSPLSAKATWY